MGSASGSLVPRITAILQLGICVFLVAEYLEDEENLPLSLLAGVPLAITAFGMLLKQRWAVPAAVAVNTLLVLVLWVAAIDQRAASVYLGAALLSLPWLVLVPYWFRERRRRRRAGEVDEHPSQELQTRSEGTPPGWTKEWGGGRVKFWSMLLFGLLSLIAGAAILLQGGIVLGISMLAFGVALVGASPMFRTWDRDGHISVGAVAGRAESGLVFPYSRSKSLAATFGLVGMAVASGGIALGAFEEQEGATPAWSVVLGTGGFLLFGWIALLSLRRNGTGAGFVALTPGGVTARLPAGQWFVPWDAIEDVRAVEMTTHVKGTTTREPFIGLVIPDLDRVEMTSAGRFFAGVNNGLLGTDLNLPVRTLDVDPRLLLGSMQFYLRTPDARAEVTRAGAGPGPLRGRLAAESRP